MSGARSADRKPVRENTGDREPPRSLKKELSEERAKGRLMAAALKMLAQRQLSEQRLRERLLSKAWVDSRHVDECLARLKELGYVDDDRYAHSYAVSRLGLRAVGRARVARELQGKKVARATINSALDEVFEEVSEEALIERAIEKRIRTHGSPANRADAKKMFDYLARLGFEYDLIIRKLREVKAETEE